MVHKLSYVLAIVLTFFMFAMMCGNYATVLLD